MNYYNEFDPFAAQWLRNLIAAGLIPAGHVDERSIKEVEANDLEGFTQCHFFAGIAGWSLALQIAGWPATKPVWTGSCPCQPFSQAGKKKGKKDERHLWPDFRALIEDCGPAIIFGEQVASADGREWLAGVRADLEALEYAVGAADMCAASIAAPHGRHRLWWVADANGNEFFGEPSTGQQPIDEQDPGTSVGLADTGSKRCGTRGRRSGEAGSPWLHRTESGSNGQLVGLANAPGVRSTEHEHDAGERPPSRQTDAADGNGAGRMGNAIGERQPVGEVEQDGRGVARQQGTAAVAPGAAWLRAGTVQCRDGRARRISVEPGDEPLAYGIPQNMGRGRTKRDRLAIRAARTNRVGRIKGYGNAINPWVAAEFIQAYAEAGKHK